MSVELVHMERPYILDAYMRRIYKNGLLHMHVHRECTQDPTVLRISWKRRSTLRRCVVTTLRRYDAASLRRCDALCTPTLRRSGHNDAASFHTVRILRLCSTPPVYIYA
jgi:hypothetical protein